MTRNEMIAALLQKYKQKHQTVYEAYEKKVKGSITALIKDEYDLLILGKKLINKKKLYIKNKSTYYVKSPTSIVDK